MSKFDLAAFRRENMMARIKEEGHELLEERGKILYLRCGSGHLFSGNWSSLYAEKSGHGCLECTHQSDNHTDPRLANYVGPGMANYILARHIPAKLYYARISLSDQVVWKIGWTRRSPYIRLSGISCPVKVIQTAEFRSTYEAEKAETEVKRTFRPFKYTGNEMEYGNTEAFTVDVLDGLSLSSFAGRPRDLFAALHAQLDTLTGR